MAQETRNDDRRPVFQLLIYPATDMTQIRPSHRRFADGYLLSASTMRWFQQEYLSSELELSDPRVSPFVTEDLRGLPPAFVQTVAPAPQLSLHLPARHACEGPHTVPHAPQFWVSVLVAAQYAPASPVQSFPPTPQLDVHLPEKQT